MKLATVRVDDTLRWGVIDNDLIRLAPTDPDTPVDLLAAIERGAPIEPSATWESRPLGNVRLEAPLPVPRRNIVCLGLNYADHAAEAQGLAPGTAELPEHPVVFTKATNTVTGTDHDVILDPRVTRRLDWEVELAFIVGRGGRFITADRAMEHVFGYTVINDLSARDRQKRHQQFFLGKSFDGACPMGPWIVTADEIADPHTLDVRCRVNGVTKQDSNTDNLIFRIPQLIELLSEVMTLQPGDIIATGTPGGVGFARTPPEYLDVGDVVECEVEGIGTIRNRIVTPA